jgi:cytochrome b subunit of formate dehydrogenase
VVETYLDSYHGWAISRGSDLVATCTDCHEVHEIRSPLDPASSVHAANVTTTCARCHEGANPTFAQSYTHVGALAGRRPHGWVRYVYLWLIAIVLGGMALHNFVVARYELRRHFRRRGREPYVQRWRRAERLQHVVLLVTFFGLAITGFALRYPDQWWVRLMGLAGHELLRAYIHRVFAVIMVGVSVYHGIWIIVTRRGRRALGSMMPRYFDVGQLVQNMRFHVGLRPTRPAFGRFDYTQKAEYWAVVWGTVVMALTGFILWYPTVATSWMPAWAVRVAEVIHFYEAILAVSAIIIWHLFYVIFMPSEYPMSTTWLDGRMPAEEWKKMHRAEYDVEGPGAIVPPEGEDMVTAADVRSHESAAKESSRGAEPRNVESGSKPGGGETI